MNCIDFAYLPQYPCTEADSRPVPYTTRFDVFLRWLMLDTFVVAAAFLWMGLMGYPVPETLLCVVGHIVIVSCLFPSISIYLVFVLWIVIVYCDGRAAQRP